MKNCFSTKCVMLAAGLLVGSGVAFGHNAGEVGTATSGYLRSANNHPVKDSYGECWKLGASAADADCEVKPAPPPPPAPVAVPAPVPAPAPAPQPVKQKVSLEADALFDFNKAILK